jgi:hypothetical protein
MKSDLLFVDLKEIMKEIEEDKKYITIEDDCVVMRWRSEYAIKLSRIKSWAHLVDWIMHLSEKGWMTPRRLRLFADVVIKAKKWKRKDA